MSVKHPDVTVPLTGEDGSIFAIVARVSRALRLARVPDREIELFHEQIQASESYDEALGVVMSWVDVT